VTAVGERGDEPAVTLKTWIAVGPKPSKQTKAKAIRSEVIRL
jgi:hypothetical protein